MHGISVCILMRNCAPYVERALRVAQQADEILVLDTGSTDNGLDIVSKYTKNIICLPTEPADMDFAYLRNVVTCKAKHDMVVHLDADEYFNPELFAFLHKNYNSLLGGVGFMRLAESYSPGYCDHELLTMQKSRVYDRRCGYWEGKIHEQLMGRCWTNGYEIKNLLWHRSFKYSDEALLTKVGFYGIVEADPTLDYHDREFWLKRFASIYAGQKMVPYPEEFKFSNEFYAAHPWQLEDVVGG